MKNTKIWRILRKIRGKLNLLKNYLRLMLFYYKSEKLKVTNKVIYFNIRDDRFERRLYSFIYFLDKTGYTISIKRNFSYLSRMGIYSRRILGLKNVFLDSKKLKKTRLVSFDESETSNCIHVSDNYYEKGDERETLKIPHSFHPNLLDFQNEGYLMTIRNQERRSIKCFFAGNTDPEVYNNKFINSVYGLYTRHQIIDHIKTTFDEFNPPYVQGKKINLIISDSDQNRVPQMELLKILSNVQFYIATPGVIIPDCHNLVEAMSVGAIPILQFPQLLYPSLRDGINCLTYDTLKKLEEILNSIFREEISQDEILKMSNNVINYYKKNLSFEGVMEKFESRLNWLKRIYLNAEYVTTEKLLDNGEKIQASN